MTFETVWGLKTTSLFWNKANNSSSFISILLFKENTHLAGRRSEMIHILYVKEANSRKESGSLGKCGVTQCRKIFISYKKESEK